MTRRLTEDEKRIRRAARQGPRQKQRMKRVVAKPSTDDNLSRVRTVQLMDLSPRRMSEEGEKRWRIVIYADQLIEWIGYDWISIRKATTEDRTRYPRLVRP